MNSQRWVCDYHKDCENGEDEYANCRKLNQHNFVVLILLYIFAVMLFINININVCYARMIRPWVFEECVIFLKINSKKSISYWFWKSVLTDFSKHNATIMTSVVGVHGQSFPSDFKKSITNLHIFIFRYKLHRKAYFKTSKQNTRIFLKT